MIDKISTIIMSFVIFGIIFVLGIFGIIIYQEIIDNENLVVEVSKVQEQSENLDNEKNEENKKEEKETIDKNIQVPTSIVENPIKDLQNYNASSNQNVSSNDKISYNNVKVNKYFYNQLDSYSKTIYRAFEANKEEMKTGTHKIEFGAEFSDLLAQENGQQKLGKYYQSAIEAYLYDNTNVFYLSPNKMYLNIETTTRGTNVTYNVFIDNGNQTNYLSDEFNSKAQIDRAISQIEQVKNEILREATGDTYEKIRCIHDNLIQSINYDTSVSKPNIYNLYGALINKECVCEGYARAFKYLLDNIGVECVMVIGTGTNSQGETENHAWNYVKLDNNWYAVDVTWDDPIVIGGGNQTQESRYRYFLKGLQEFNQNHIPNGQFSEEGKVFTYPTVSNKNYK